MVAHKYIFELLTNGYECEYLDFKKVQYQKESHNDLITDVMSMANSLHRGDKYIILGVKDNPKGIREIIGIPQEEFIDSSIYQEVVINNIEPEIKFDYFPVEYHNKILGVIKIHADNTNRPYMLKKRFRNLNEGLCKIRKGSVNAYPLRKDYDDFYTGNDYFEVRFMENSLMAVYDEQGCARTSVTIRNLTKKPVVLNYGLLSVISKNGALLSKHRVFGLGKIIGADFQLALSPMEEKLGDLYVGFESSDCLRLGINEYGNAQGKFIFELELTDTYYNKYLCRIDDGFIVVKGKFLWKVQSKANKELKKHKSWSLF